MKGNLVEAGGRNARLVDLLVDDELAPLRA